MTSTFETLFIPLPGAIEQRIVKTLLSHVYAAADETIRDDWWQRLYHTLLDFADRFGDLELPRTGIPGAFIVVSGDTMTKFNLLDCTLAPDDFGN